MKTETVPTFVKSSGNIFADLRLEDADELQAKSELIISIHKVMKQRRLTQKAVADLCGIDQPTISKLLRGKFESITIDRLTQLITRLGSDVEIKVKTKQRYSGKPGHLRVSA